MNFPKEDQPNQAEEPDTELEPSRSGTKCQLDHGAFVFLSYVRPSKAKVGATLPGRIFENQAADTEEGIQNNEQQGDQQECEASKLG